jgi:hypothetical protein
VLVPRLLRCEVGVSVDLGSVSAEPAASCAGTACVGIWSSECCIPTPWVCGPLFTVRRHDVRSRPSRAMGRGVGHDLLVGIQSAEAAVDSSRLGSHWKGRSCTGENVAVLCGCVLTVKRNSYRWDLQEVLQGERPVGPSIGMWLRIGGTQRVTAPDLIPTDSGPNTHAWWSGCPRNRT